MVLSLVPVVALAGSAASAGADAGAAGTAVGQAVDGAGVAAACIAGVPSDFNGDGITDIAIADPSATVNGVGAAGRVHVVYGGGRGSQTFSQADSFVYSDPESGDRFGFAMASYDANGDGCSDLAVSTPSESLGTASQTGMVEVLYGSTSGFGVAGSAIYSQDTTGMPGVIESGDRFGFSLAAGKTAAGASFLVIGVPGEDTVDSNGVEQVDSGAFMYVRGTTKLLIHQDLPGVPGLLEHYDQYGLAVAATTDHIAVAGPGDEVQSSPSSGSVGVYSHTVVDGVLDALGLIDQAQTGHLDETDPNDWLGRSLSMVSYIPSSGAPRQSLLAIGVPGEAIANDSQMGAGRVVAVEATGQLTERSSIHQDSAYAYGVAESGDYFGWAVQLVNRNPTQPATWQNLLLAAGVPGEEGTSPLNPGAVHVFSMVAAPGDHDVWVPDLLSGLGWSQEDGLLGRHLGASKNHLYVANPFGPTPAVYAVPWRNITDGATDPIVVYAPGSHGLPTSGVGTFGAVIA